MQSFQTSYHTNWKLVEEHDEQCLYEEDSFNPIEVLLLRFTNQDFTAFIAHLFDTRGAISGQPLILLFLLDQSQELKI